MNIMPDFPIRFRAIPDSRLLWRSWDSDQESGSLDVNPLQVVYCLDSDDTHLMNDLGAAIIHILQEGACTVDELLDALAAEYLPVPELRDVIPRSVVEAFLHRMQMAGMIFEVGATD